MGLLAGTGPVIAEFLGLPGGRTPKQRSTCLGLNGLLRTEAEFQALVEALYGFIQANPTGRVPSRENWRVTLQTSLSIVNRSREVLLERAIAKLAEGGTLRGWMN